MIVEETRNRGGQRPPASLIDDVLASVSVSRQIGVKEIRGVSHLPAIVAARWDAWLWLVDLGYGAGHVAEAFGVSRTSILNAKAKRARAIGNHAPVGRKLREAA